MKSVSVAGTTLDLPRNTYYGEGKSVAIDIGTTLTYLPEKVYNAMMIEIFDKHQGTLFYDIQNLLYIKHYGRVDDVFPEITLHFEGGLALNIYPHDYLLNNGSDWYFVGLRNGRSQPVNLRDMIWPFQISLSSSTWKTKLSDGWTTNAPPALILKMSEKLRARLQWSRLLVQ
nr:aspartic proteinase-like protein 2 [Setaria viridis]XP_034571424.1 aspartic proteinase-like protein 2 [Setaria viridis]XP_034571425.1 aspartic proteinase-like protein 2 [Setaria viridis]